MGVVVGNKKDLDIRRQVSTTQGEDWARGQGLDFVEVSAVSPPHVNPTYGPTPPISRPCAVRHCSSSRFRQALWMFYISLVCVEFVCVRV